MKIKIICTGKNIGAFIQEGVDEYMKRIKKYTEFEIIYTKSSKKTKSGNIYDIKKQEADFIKSYIEKNEYVILLDEKGKMQTSMEFAYFLEKKVMNRLKTLVFIIGGAHGFSEELYKRSNEILSLSKMTFPHQLVRIIFLEQLYRALTIMNNEPYHNG